MSSKVTPSKGLTDRQLALFNSLTDDEWATWSTTILPTLSTKGTIEQVEKRVTASILKFARGLEPEKKAAQQRIDLPALRLTSDELDIWTRDIASAVYREAKAANPHITVDEATVLFNASMAAYADEREAARGVLA